MSSSGYLATCASICHQGLYANYPLLAAVQVDYYGAPTPLKSLASIAVPDASTLLISPFDKGGLKDIEKAINESDIGINPNNDGEKIRLNIPAMTQVRGHSLRLEVASQLVVHAHWCQMLFAQMCRQLPSLYSFWG